MSIGKISYDKTLYPCCPTCGSYPCQKELACLMRISNNPLCSKNPKSGGNMSGVSTAYLEKRIELLQKELDKRIEVEARFGTEEDYDDGTILVWDQRYEKNGRVYTFTALKIAGAWYSSSLFQSQRWDFAHLVEAHLSKADKIWIVTEMREF